MPTSQCKKILAYLKEGNGITTAIAVDKFGCYRLAARISDLKKKGYNIGTEMVGKGFGSYAEYRLVPEVIQ